MTLKLFGVLPAIIMLVGAGVLSGCGKTKAAAANPSRGITETALLKADPMEIASPIAISADFRHLALCLRREGQDAVWFDGKLGKAYPTIKWLCFSRDEQHVLYQACTKTQQSVVCDGNEGPWFERMGDLDAINMEPYSRDGVHTAYVAQKGKQQVAVIDGVVGPAFDYITRPMGSIKEYTSLIISPDGTRTGYIGVRGKQQCVVIDGKQGPWFDEVSLEPPMRDRNACPLFTADGKHTAYAANRGTKAFVVIDGVVKERRPGAFYDIYRSPDGSSIAYYDGEHLVINGKKFGPIYNCTSDGPTFSPDGSRFAIEEGSDVFGDGWKVAVDGKAGKDYQRVSSITFSPDSKHIAYFGQRNGAWYLVKDGTESPISGEGDQLAFSPDGAHFAYACRAGKGQQSQLVVDDKKSPLVNGRILNVQYSPDSAHVAAVVDSPGKACVILDTTPGPIYQSVSPSVDFSADGKHTLYLATKSEKVTPPKPPSGKTPAPTTVTRSCVVVDGVEGPGFDLVQAAWLSPDGKHVAASVRQNGKWQVVVDGKSLLSYDTPSREAYHAVEVYNKLNFDKQGILHAYGFRGGTLYHAMIDVSKVK